MRALMPFAFALLVFPFWASAQQPPVQPLHSEASVAAPSSSAGNSDTLSVDEIRKVLAQNVVEAPGNNGQASSAPRVDAAARPAPSHTPAPPTHRSVRPPPAVIHATSGKNVLFGVAVDHLNRIVTPFKHPVVKTTSTAATSVEGNVVYVSTTSYKAIGFYIHDANSPDHVLSLTMVPSNIPPVSVTLDLVGYAPTPDNAMPVAGDLSKAREWETSSSYLAMIKSLFRDLAKGIIPNGYSFSPMSGKTSPMPRCALTGLRVEALQLLTGYRVDVVISRVTNPGYNTQVIDEKACADSDAVLAVAAWPNRELPAGGETELFVAVRKPKKVDRETRLPSLIGGRH